jgi:hypothetical protein
LSDGVVFDKVIWLVGLSDGVVFVVSHFIIWRAQYNM